MTWKVDLHDDFLAVYLTLHKDVQDELLAHIALLERFGPQLGRPRADTLNSGSEKRFYRHLIEKADDRFR